jgi:hypothetical protein
MTSSVEDKEQIRELLASYCFHSDSGDAEAFVNLFTDDGVLDLGTFGVYRGGAALLEAQRRKGGQPAKVRHLTTNILIELKADKAEVRSYVAALDVGETPAKVIFAGHYYDTVARYDGRWRFKLRRARPLPIDTERP